MRNVCLCKFFHWSCLFSSGWRTWQPHSSNLSEVCSVMGGVRTLPKRFRYNPLPNPYTLAKPYKFGRRIVRSSNWSEVGSVPLDNNLPCTVSEKPQKQFLVPLFRNISDTMPHPILDPTLVFKTAEATESAQNVAHSQAFPPSSLWSSLSVCKLEAWEWGPAETKQFGFRQARIWCGWNLASTPDKR